MPDSVPLFEGLVRRSLTHDSAERHVSGSALYTDDVPEMAGMLHLAFGQSPHAHARILSVDLQAVRAAPEVVAVFTHADIPGNNNVAPVAGDDRLLAVDRVEYVGQSIFLVAARSATAARRAAKLAKIEYEVLPALLTIAEARAAGSKIEASQVMTTGDATAGLENSRHKLKGSVEIGGQDHFYLEGQIAVATPGEGGGMHVLCSSQHPSEVQHLIAHILHVNSADVTVEVRRMGGGFGGKETQAALFAGACALVAAKTGKPAKFRCDRDDDMVMTGKRHDFTADFEVGFDNDGVITGLKLDLASRCGMSVDLSPAINDRAMFHADNCYYLENIEIISHRFKTHTVSNTAFRGFGGPQGMLAIERVMDAVALHLGRDPLDVRRANFYRDDHDMTPYGMRVEDFVADKIVADLCDLASFSTRKARIDAFNQTHPYLKRGLALTPVKFGISFTTSHLNQAGALIHLYTDGSVHLNHGGTEMGQGLNTKVAQVVADVFGVGMDKIRITATRTDKVPNTSATAASSGTDLNGMAAYNAAQTLRGRLAEFMAERHKCAADEVVFADGKVHAGGESLTFGHVCRLAHVARISLSSTGYYATPKIYYDRATHKGRPFLYFSYGAAVSEVVIDTLTGESRVLRADILHDVGRSLNPAIDLGQVEGAYVQGMGWLTTEELVFDAKGRLLSHAPSTYKIPCASDRPDVFNVQLWNPGHNREPTIHRSKAVGEPPFMLALSVLSALSYAVAAATGSPAITLDAPATPERILAAIAEAGKMRNWAQQALDGLEGGQLCALISLLAVEGSAPRGPGTRMLVTPTKCVGTIGGGNLEFQAIKQARAVLSHAPGTWRIQDYPLGPFLGQCCGGRVRLMVEHLDQGQRDWLEVAREQGSVTLETRLFDDHIERRVVTATALQALTAPETLPARGPQPSAGSSLIEAVGEPSTPLAMFGAGHVGQAIARIIDGLPLSLSWYDTRPECAGMASVEVAEAAVLAEAARQATGLVLILTHDHALDYKLTGAALSGEASFIGLIGSATKRARFISRLRKDGFSDAALARLCCPIGIAGITGKAPEVIAVSVAAQLLMLR